MHRRSENFDGHHIAYKDVTVCKEWWSYQNFAKWYDEHFYEVEGDIMCLDKDILIPGNKIYRPEACCFLPNRLNEIFHNMTKIRENGMPIGIVPMKRTVREDGYRLKVTYVNDEGKRIYLSKVYDDLETAKYIYSKFKQVDTRRIVSAYKDIIPNYIYQAIYNYEFKY